MLTESVKTHHRFSTFLLCGIETRIASAATERGQPFAGGRFDRGDSNEIIADLSRIAGE